MENRQGAMMNHQSSKAHNESVPSLLECVFTIKSLGNVVGNDDGSKKLTQLFTSCIAFLSYIHLDRTTIEKYSKDAFPSPREIPAISLLFEDRKLFLTFLSMIRSSNRSTGINTKHHGLNKNNATSFHGKTDLNNQQNPINLNAENRKRSCSGSSIQELNTPNKKIAKLLHSPYSDRKDVNCVQHNLGSAIPLPLMSSSSPVGTSLDITANISIIAVTTFYSALQYLDQWPAILVKAYAEDSFGPRSWVDDKRSLIFTQNLLSTHKNKSTEKKSDYSDDFVTQCKLFLGDVDETCTPEKSSHKPAHLDTTKHRIRTMHLDATNLIKASLQSSKTSSDSGEEEIVMEDALGLVLSHKRKRIESNCASSSGKEAQEEKILMSKSLSNLERNPDFNPFITNMPLIRDDSKKNERSGQTWWCPNKIHSSKIRDRFFGSNVALANSMIARALSHRLDLKMKQNSSLLSTLPVFLSISMVREMASSQLEKWLQSPALSGLARNLFSCIVTEIENTDPPLPEDVNVIHNILSMTLKANQFDIHVKKVLEIVQKVPTRAVCDQIFGYLLRRQLEIISDEEIPTRTEVSDQMKMLQALFIALEPRLAYSALSSSLILLLYTETHNERKTHIDDICNLVRLIAASLDERYDGCFLVDSLLKCTDIKYNHQSLILLSRLIFECVLLMVPNSVVEEISLDQSKFKSMAAKLDEVNMMSKAVSNTLTKKLQTVKKSILSSYLLSGKWAFEITSSEISSSLDRIAEPDYNSILDCDTISHTTRPNGVFIDILMTLLFLYQPESKQVRFLLQTGLENRTGKAKATPLPEELKTRIRVCMNCGCHIDNQVLETVIDSVLSKKAPMGANDAISLLEQILYHCREDANSSILVDDITTICSLFKLATYQPSIPTNSSIPELANPAIWWRVTYIILIFCGTSPHVIGAHMWKTSPTIQALIKMVTSGKFKFPTTDCDEIEREKMSIGENDIRDKEYEIAELLFLPPSKKSHQRETASVSPVASRFNKGSRTSSRQRDKQERLLTIQREKEKAREMVEAQRRRQKLKKAQKSIMIMDPRCKARKPRKESIQLLFSIDNIFQLADKFKSCRYPDFVLATIGSTSRDSIERAYDWLIPTISSSANIINRLPPSASCFLLLRAYGAQGEENNQLLELASPLLKHVNDSIVGEFGIDGAKRAADILFFDLAHEETSRRRCARRVLQESLGKLSFERDCASFAVGDFSWLLSLAKTTYSSQLVTSITPRLLNALSVEKGKVLRAYILALDYFFKNCIIDTESRKKFNLTSTLCDMIALRPKVYIYAMEAYDDLKSVLIRKCRMAIRSIDFNDDDNGVSLMKSDKQRVIISHSVVQASLVLIASWNDTHRPMPDDLMNILNFLLPQHDVCDQTLPIGASSAVFVKTKKRAISVENWVILVKSQSELIARRAVLAVPDIFLPRLLLCCGLPQSSFTTLIHRLNAISKNVKDTDKQFRQLVSSTNGLGSMKRTIFIRMLLGRISAYKRLFYKNENEHLKDLLSNSSFVLWLQSESTAASTKSDTVSDMSHEIVRKKKVYDVVTENQSQQILQAPALLPNLQNHEFTQFSILERTITQSDKVQFDEDNCISKETIMNLLKSGSIEKLDSVLDNTFENRMQNKESFDNMSVTLMTSFGCLSHEECNESVGRLILHWIPKLTKDECSNRFWIALFGSGKKGVTDSSCNFKNLLLTHCLLLWSTGQIIACQNWILNKIGTKQFSNFDITLCLKCFLYPLRHSRCNEKELFDLLATKAQTESAVKLAMLGAHDWSITLNNDMDPWIDPKWMSFLIAIAGIDKKHLGLICEILLDNLSSTSWEGKLLPIAILKLYATFPMDMNLGDAKIREVLLKAFNENSPYWFGLETSLDSQFDSAISLLSDQLHRHHQVLFDLIKKHPLIAVKHMQKVEKVIKMDALTHQLHWNRNESLIYANTDDGMKKVNVMHWGMEFTERLWLTVLDMIAIFPDTVTYSETGWLGLEQIFLLVLQLLYVQFDLVPPVGGESLRVRDQFSIVLNISASPNRLQTEWFDKEIKEFNSRKVKDILDFVGINHMKIQSE